MVDLKLPRLLFFRAAFVTHPFPALVASCRLASRSSFLGAKAGLHLATALAGGLLSRTKNSTIPHLYGNIRTVGGVWEMMFFDKSGRAIARCDPVDQASIPLNQGCLPTSMIAKSGPKLPKRFPVKWLWLLTRFEVQFPIKADQGSPIISTAGKSDQIKLPCKHVDNLAK
jgi:hypothetical protein